jgi:cellulose synthase/poly-beta-1,6-N-acetylglucosamine synthase-like glycosyltransferase
MTLLDASVLVTYYLTLGVLAVYSVHRLHLVRLRRRFGAAATRGIARIPETWPKVAVQLPLFNEPNVAARLIDAVAAIEYDGVLSIQLLDDSTDETSAIVAERVAAWRARGVDITHIRRASRDGYKAGALAHGMQLSDAQLFAVFDADFVPPPQILREIVPYFFDARVGMVQARWGHLNRTRSMLTRVQAIYLDAHFAVESAARHLGERFFNFNGTAGVWRREAIESAGGWSASTLTEDLDLSYRAQLEGWDFVFLPSIEVPAELPETLSGFQEQQHRWAKGSIQTARKILPRIWRSAHSRRVKAEATFHLTNNSAYLLTTLIALLIVPAIVIRQRLGLTPMLIGDALLFAISTGSVLLFYIEGQRFAGRPRPSLRELMAVLPIGIGISIRNSAAVLEGLAGRGGHFKRTPKHGASATVSFERPPRVPVGELLLSGFFIAALVLFSIARQWVSLPFVMLFLGGYAYVGIGAMRERLSFKWPLRCSK